MFPVQMSPEWLRVNGLMFEDFDLYCVRSSKTYDELRSNVYCFITNYKKYIHDLTDGINNCETFKIKNNMRPPYITDVLMYIRYCEQDCDEFIKRTKQISSFDKIRSSFKNLISSLENNCVSYRGYYSDFCRDVLLTRPYNNLYNTYKLLMKSYNQNNKNYIIKNIIDYCFNIVQFINWAVNSSIVKTTRANTYFEDDTQRVIDNALLELSIIRRKINEQSSDIDNIRKQIDEIMNEFKHDCNSWLGF
jgi:hypothetical protein